MRMRPGEGGLEFRLVAYRFEFRATTPLYFPAGKAGNIVRGALGLLLRRTACDPQCREAEVCRNREHCPYVQCFEPRRSNGTSGLADPPRPFVIRALQLDGCRIQPGQLFHWDLHVFEQSRSLVPHFAAAFAALRDEGLGPGRGRAELVYIRPIHADRQTGAPLLSDGILHSCEAEPVRLPLTPATRTVTRVRLGFLSPTEWKGNGGLAAEPDFPTLFARLRDRLSTLRHCYGPGPLPIDFAAMAARAAEVRLTASRLRLEKVERLSTRTGQIHPLQGFVGEVEYEGPLTEFLPYLSAGFWTGVGRQTSWGKGVVDVLETNGDSGVDGRS